MTLPALSVILLAPTDFAHIRKAVRYLQAQSRVAEIELVIATPSTSNLSCDPDSWNAFHSVRIVEVGTIREASPAKIKAFGISCAQPIAFTEDHAFVSPNWAEVLIQAHAEPY